MGITDIITEIANAIRKKSGESEKMQMEAMPGKILKIGFPIAAFGENTANGCHVEFGMSGAEDYTVTLNECVLSGVEKLAFIFQGDGVEIMTQAVDSSLRVSVYDVSQFELKKYTYTVGDTQKRAISVVRKSTASADSTVLRTETLSTNGDEGTVVPLSLNMNTYGTYIVVAQKTGSADLRVKGIRVNT